MAKECLPQGRKREPRLRKELFASVPQPVVARSAYVRMMRSEEACDRRQVKRHLRELALANGAPDYPESSE